MVWAMLFFLGFCTVAFGSILLLSRGRTGTRITGPVVRTVDYDNPYGRGAFFWTNRRISTSSPPPAQGYSEAADAWPGFGPLTTPLTFGAAAKRRDEVGDGVPDERPVAMPGQVS